MSMENKRHQLVMIKAAKIAITKWRETDNPTHPFGFSFLGWSFEVHVECKKNPRLGVYLQVYRVQPDGTMKLWIRDMKVT